MTNRIEIRQFGKELASFPTDNLDDGYLAEQDFMTACLLGDALHRRRRLGTGYYEVVLVGPIGDSGLVGELDSMEAVA